MEKARVHYQRALNIAVRSYKPYVPPDSEERVAMRREFELAYRYCPDSWSSAFALMWSLEESGEKDRARELAEKLEKEPRRSPFIDNFLAHRLNERGEYGRALAILEKATWPPDTPLRIEMTLETMRAHVGLGNLRAILDLAGKRLMACEHDEARLHLLYHIEELALRLPKEALRGINVEEFESGLKRMIAESPEEVGFPVALAAFYARMGRSQEELATLVAAVEHHAQSVEFRHHFARVVWRSVATQEKPTIP
ncbi:MAG: hypothetical protein HYY16_19420 [Planctomycetes bacterium]|nr:hypothetical protein [Planctomycetota bacterium]